MTHHCIALMSKVVGRGKLSVIVFLLIQNVPNGGIPR